MFRAYLPSGVIIECGNLNHLVDCARIELRYDRVCILGTNAQSKLRVTPELKHCLNMYGIYVAYDSIGGDKVTFIKGTMVGLEGEEPCVGDILSGGR